MSARTFIATALAVATLATCADAHAWFRRKQEAWAPTPVVADPAPSAQPTPGAIYGGQSALKLFEDNKARDPGDLVTIVLIERTSAQTSATTEVSKDSVTSISAPTLFGAPLTYGGRDILSAEADAGRGFKGDADSAQSNRLTGEITATVVQRLPNGNLVVRGEKRIRLNQGDETVSIQGVVRATDIGPDNRIASGRVADARIVYGGRGPVAKSNVMGWLSKFFNSAWMPL